MTRRSTAFLLRAVIALAVTITMLLSAIHVTSSHNPVALAQAEAQRHAELALEIAGHGHSHADGTDTERLPGHLHGHNSADHVHDAANVPPTQTTRDPAPVRMPRTPLHDAEADGLRHGLERPPRPIVA